MCREWMQNIQDISRLYSVFRDRKLNQTSQSLKILETTHQAVYESEGSGVHGAETFRRKSTSDLEHFEGEL